MRTALVLALLSSCTVAKAVVITGESMDAAGQQFVIASNGFQRAQVSGGVSSEQFLKWAEFSSRFRATYNKSVDSLKAARAIGDDVAARDLEAAIGRILVELAGHYGLLVELGVIPKAAP